MQVPHTLYQYTACSRRSLKNLKSRLIYFNAPINFNDPYDCALFPTIRALSDEDVEKIRNHELHREDLSEAFRAELKAASIESLRSRLSPIGAEALNKAIQDFLSQRGVSCFSERRDNLLMWSHYGGKHKGFCLEFSTDSPPLKGKLHQVAYAKEMPSVDLLPMLCEKNFEQVFDLFCTKSKDWSYELEWRAVLDAQNTPLEYPQEALTGIYFGSQASKKSIDAVAQILSARSSTVSIWRGVTKKLGMLLHTD